MAKGRYGAQVSPPPIFAKMVLEISLRSRGRGQKFFIDVPHFYSPGHAPEKKLSRRQLVLKNRCNVAIHREYFLH